MTDKQICPVTHKVCYSQKEANGIVNTIKRQKKVKQPKVIPQRSYYCHYCRTYHLTHYRRFETCKATIRRGDSRGSDRFKEDIIS